MRVTGKAVVEAVARCHGLDYEDLVGMRRSRAYAWPRQEAMYEVYRRCPHLSYPAIGKLFGRDHTTVLYGVREHCLRNGIVYREVPRASGAPRDVARMGYRPSTVQQYREVARIW